MDASQRYKAFMSYSHADQSFAAWLHTRLERYRIPGRKERLFPIFRDREELATSSDLSGSVTEALKCSETLIVLCSPHAAVSPWVNAEVETFLRFGRADRVQCIIVDGPADAGPETLFPPALLDAGFEPLAADVRKEGRQAALLKLVAGLVGVSFDSLVRRDARRRQRQLAMVAAASTVGMLLAVSLATFAWFSRQEALAAQARADQEAAAARQVANFLTELFEDADLVLTGGALTAEEMLDRGAHRLEQDLLDQPLTRARLMQVVGSTYANLARHDKAESMLQEALEERRRLLGPEHLDVAVTLSRLGVLRMDQGRYDEAIELYEEALALCKSNGAVADAALVYVRMAALYNETRRYPAAQTNAQAALDGYEISDDLLGRASALRELGVAHYRRSEHVEAQAALDEALDILEEYYGPNDARTAPVLHTLVHVAERSGRYASSLALAERLTGIWDRVYGDAIHSRVADGYNLQAVSLWRLGRLGEAEQGFRDALEIYESVYGPDHVRVAMAENNLALVLLKNERFTAAETGLSRALSIYETQFGADDPRVGTIISNIGSAVAGLGRLEEAVTLEHRALNIREKAFGADSPLTARSLNMLGGYFVQQRNFTDAERMLVRGLEIRRATLTSDHPEVGSSLEALAEMELARGDPVAARDYLDNALRTLEQGLNEDHPRLDELRAKLINVTASSP